MNKIFNHKIVSFVIIGMCILMNVLYAIQTSRGIIETIALIALNALNFLYFVELPKNIYRAALLNVLYSVVQVIYNLTFAGSNANILVGTIVNICIPLLMIIAIERTVNAKLKGMSLKQKIRENVPMVEIGTRSKIIIYILMMIMILQIGVSYKFDYMTNTYFMRVMYAAVMILPTLLTLSTYTFSNVTVDMYIITLIAETIVVFTGFETKVITASQIIMLITEYIILIYLLLERGKNAKIAKLLKGENKQITEQSQD